MDTNHIYVKLSDVSKLLERTPEAAYWSGLLHADGSTNPLGRIKLMLADKDRTHLNKFLDFVCWEGGLDHRNGSTGVQLQDRELIGFMPTNKTYNPPKDIPYIESDLRFAFSVGFVDGDGCISKYHNRLSYFLSVKCHLSWENMLRLIGAELSPQWSIHYNAGYPVLHIGNSEYLKAAKLRALGMELPLLERKWDNIDLEYLSREELGRRRIKQIYEMLDQGYRKGEIAKELGISPSAVSQVLKRHPRR